MFYRYLYLTLSCLAFTGCAVSLQNTTSTNSSSYDAAAAFQEQISDLGNTLELESQLDNLFVNETTNTATYVYPMANYTTQKTRKAFGQYISPDSGDRFNGYHTGDDIEVTDKAVEVPVYALTAATLVQKQTVSGYGGVVILEFTDTDVNTGITVIYHALYGHLDLASVSLVIGDTIAGGEQLGVLGDDGSAETDGERKHLHFGLYPYTGTELYAGYVADDSFLTKWLNPADFLRDHQAT